MTNKTFLIVLGFFFAVMFLHWYSIQNTENNVCKTGKATYIHAGYERTCNE